MSQEDIALMNQQILVVKGVREKLEKAEGRLLQAEAKKNATLIQVFLSMVNGCMAELEKAEALLAKLEEVVSASESAAPPVENVEEEILPMEAEPLSTVTTPRVVMPTPDAPSHPLNQMGATLPPSLPIGLGGGSVSGLGISAPALPLVLPNPILTTNQHHEKAELDAHRSGVFPHHDATTLPDPKQASGQEYLSHVAVQALPAFPEKSTTKTRGRSPDRNDGGVGSRIKQRCRSVSSYSSYSSFSSRSSYSSYSSYSSRGPSNKRGKRSRSRSPRKQAAAARVVPASNYVAAQRPPPEINRDAPRVAEARGSDRDNDEDGELIGQGGAVSHIMKRKNEDSDSDAQEDVNPTIRDALARLNAQEDGDRWRALEGADQMEQELREHEMHEEGDLGGDTVRPSPAEQARLVIERRDHEAKESFDLVVQSGLLGPSKCADDTAFLTADNVRTSCNAFFDDWVAKKSVEDPNKRNANLYMVMGEKKAALAKMYWENNYGSGSKGRGGVTSVLGFLIQPDYRLSRPAVGPWEQEMATLSGFGKVLEPVHEEVQKWIAWSPHHWGILLKCGTFDAEGLGKYVRGVITNQIQDNQAVPQICDRLTENLMHIINVYAQLVMASCEPAALQSILHLAYQSLIGLCNFSYAALLTPTATPSTFPTKREVLEGDVPNMVVWVHEHLASLLAKQAVERRVAEAARQATTLAPWQVEQPPVMAQQQTPRYERRDPHEGQRHGSSGGYDGGRRYADRNHERRVQSGQPPRRGGHSGGRGGGGRDSYRSKNQNSRRDSRQGGGRGRDPHKK